MGEEKRGHSDEWGLSPEGLWLRAGARTLKPGVSTSGRSKTEEPEKEGRGGGVNGSEVGWCPHEGVHVYI